MISLAVHYNNVGVDILSSFHIADKKAITSIDRDERSGKACAKRRKRSITQNIDVKNIETTTKQNVDDALAYFQKALSLIVETTEHHRYHGDGLKYHPNDADGFMRHENEAMAKQLAGSIIPCSTNTTLEGEKGCSNAYIYCKAIKIGGERTTNNSRITNNNNKEDADGDSCCGCDFTRALNEQEQLQNTHCENNLFEINLTYREGYGRPVVSGGYESLAKSLFHSMICIYNIALCYHYKGMATKKEAKRLMNIESSIDSRTHRANNQLSIEIDELVGATEYFLKASVDHYTRAYELMTRFRLENGPQYTLLMATMNNLAATYQSLEQSYKAEVCNRYLVRSLILIICSSERDGHLGQEVLSRSHDDEEGNHDDEIRNRRGVLSREEDRTCFESFLSNVTHLMMGVDETYHGEITAAAA